MLANAIRTGTRRVVGWMSPGSVVALILGAALALWLWWPFDGSAVPPSERAVTIEAAGCGLASPTSGVGVAVGGNRVVTAAHTLAQAADVRVLRNGASMPAQVVVWDAEVDLAVLEVPDLDLAPVRFSALDSGDGATLALAGATVPADVTMVARVTIEEVLGTERHSRSAYQLRAGATDGDSGAGLFDLGGRLAGVLFATETDSGLVWATAAAEVETALSRPPVIHRCVPEDSRLRPVSGS